MGTKNNPGKFDCHAKAEPNEPLFTLLGRDPLAHGLVELWVHLRAGDVASAVFCFGYLVALTRKLPPETSQVKLAEAMSCAADMRGWLPGDGLPPTHVHVEGQDDAY